MSSFARGMERRARAANGLLPLDDEQKTYRRFLSRWLAGWRVPKSFKPPTKIGIGPSHGKLARMTALRVNKSVLGLR